MNRNFLSVAAILGALSVALGAFAAHKLKTMVGPETVATFETGVRYQFYHVFALLFVAFLSEKIHNRWMIWAGNCFIYLTALPGLCSPSLTDRTGSVGKPDPEGQKSLDWDITIKMRKGFFIGQDLWLIDLA